MRQSLVRVLALLVAGVGVVNVLSAVTPSLQARLRLLAPYVPGDARHAAHLAAALLGFALLLLAGGLWRRKRTAWLLTLLLLAASAVSHLLKGLDWEEAAVALSVGAALWMLRAEFQAQSDRPSVRQALWVLAAAVLFTLAYGTAGFYLLDRHFHVNFGFPAALQQTLAMFLEFSDPGLQPLTGFGRYFAASIYAVGAGTLGYALLMFLRPVLVRVPATPAEREQARRIVEQYGCTSLAPFALLPDKAYFFSPGGSVIQYVAKGGVAVTLGDPIGPREDVAPAVEAFRTFCAHNDWRPAFYQVLPDHLDAYRAAGFQLLHIGDEAIIELARFTLEGKAGKTLRGAVHRATKAGYRSEYREPPHPAALLRELREVSDEWLSMMHGREKRFSLGWFDEAYLNRGPVMLIRGPDGRIAAFANLLSEYRKNEATLDLMRRRRQVEGGTMDFLFVSLFQWAQERGYDTFNLGLSALAGVGDSAEDPAVERALHYLYEHLDQFYNFQGLHAFKDKFRPTWEPRYLAYPGAASLPAVALALIRADSGDDFFLDYLRDWLSQRKLRPNRPVGPVRNERAGA